MSDVSRSLVKLDAMLEAWDMVDDDSMLDPQLSGTERERVKSDLGFRRVMELTSLEMLRREHIDRVAAAHGVGAADYLFALLRVHTPHELTYHELLSALIAGRHPNIHEAHEISRYWSDWWQRRWSPRKYCTLDWKTHSPVLSAALQALSDDTSNADSYVEHSHPLVRQSVARRADIPMHIQLRLVTDPAFAVRHELAMNASTGPPVLVRLAEDVHSIVRRWAAVHPQTPTEVRERVALDPIVEVREFVRRHLPSPGPSKLSECLPQDSGNTCAKEPRSQTMPADLLEALQLHDIPTVIEILNASPELIHSRSHEDETPLHLVVGNPMSALTDRAVPLCNELIIRGADVAAVKSDGTTPLHLVVVRPWGYSFDLARLLLQAGADPHAQAEGGNTPLQSAVRMDALMRTDMVALLLEFE